MDTTRYFTRKQTVALVLICFVLNWIGQYYAIPSRLIGFLNPAQSSQSPLSSSVIQTPPVEKFVANALIGKISSIKTEGASTIIELSLPLDKLYTSPRSVAIQVTKDTKITQRILKPKAEVDAITAKFWADVKKDPNTPLPVDSLVASIKTLSVTDLKIGDSINIYPLENIAGKTLAEIKALTAEFILLK